MADYVFEEEALSKEEEKSILEFEKDNSDSCRRIVRSYFGLVLSIAKPYKNIDFKPPLSYEDLIHEGVLGIYNAIESFQGGNFQGYVRSYIQNNMRGYLRKNFFHVYVPNNKIYQAFKLRRYTIDQTKKTRSPTIEQKAQYMNCSEEAILELEQIINLKFCDHIQDYPVHFCSSIADDEILEKVLEHINKFSSKDRELMYLRYQKALSWRDIGDIMGFSHESVRKRHNKLIQNIRDSFVY